MRGRRRRGGNIMDLRVVFIKRSAALVKNCGNCYCLKCRSVFWLGAWDVVRKKRKEKEKNDKREKEAMCGGSSGGSGRRCSLF
jgi:hypothetical protein